MSSERQRGLWEGPKPTACFSSVPWIGPWITLQGPQHPQKAEVRDHLEGWEVVVDPWWSQDSSSTAAPSRMPEPPRMLSHTPIPGTYTSQCTYSASGSSRCPSTHKHTPLTAGTAAPSLLLPWKELGLELSTWPLPQLLRASPGR